MGSCKENMPQNPQAFKAKTAKSGPCFSNLHTEKGMTKTVRAYRMHSRTKGPRWVTWPIKQSDKRSRAQTDQMRIEKKTPDFTSVIPPAPHPSHCPRHVVSCQYKHLRPTKCWSQFLPHPQIRRWPAEFALHQLHWNNVNPARSGNASSPSADQNELSHPSRSQARRWPRHSRSADSKKNRNGSIQRSSRHIALRSGHRTRSHPAARKQLRWMSNNSSSLKTRGDADRAVLSTVPPRKALGRSTQASCKGQYPAQQHVRELTILEIPDKFHKTCECQRSGTNMCKSPADREQPAAGKSYSIWLQDKPQTHTKAWNILPLKDLELLASTMPFAMLKQMHSHSSFHR